jgi:hypothetical protein
LSEDTTRESPLFTSIIPSVAMKGGIFNLAIRVPEITPLKAPMAIAATRPNHNGSCQSLKTTPAVTAVNVIRQPTERSMPPVMMTKVLAIARTPLTAVDCRMPMILSTCMKAGEAKAK